MLYFVYGMNTNRQSMASRCPTAIDLGYAKLLGGAFRFAGCADIVANDDSVVDGVLWSITDNDLAALDSLEGFPTFYDRMEFDVEHNGKLMQAIAYFMNPGFETAPPSQSYYDMVRIGYHEHDVPDTQILFALEACYELQD